MANPATVVRIELRLPGRASTFHEVTSAEFLIGSVLGCDLIIPGGDLPPVFGSIARTENGLRLRKQAPNFRLLLNNKPVHHAPLGDGDTITAGRAELIVHLTASPVLAAAGATGLGREATLPPPPRQQPRETRFVPPMMSRFTSYETPPTSPHSREQVSALEREKLDASVREHREELARLERQRAAIESTQNEIQARLNALQEREQQIQRDAILVEDRSRSLAQAEATIHEEEERLARLRAEVVADKAQVEVNLVEAERRNATLRSLEEFLERSRESLNHDAKALAGQQQEIESHRRELAVQHDQLADREARLEVQERELREQQRLFEDRTNSTQVQFSDLSQRELSLQNSDAALREREAALGQQQQALEIQAQQLRSEADRLNRKRDSVDIREREAEDREAELERRAIELDQRAVQLERQTHGFTEQSRRLSETESLLQAELIRLRQTQAEYESNVTRLAEQAATSDGQQAILASLRGKMERMREELRTQAEDLVEQRKRIEERELEIANRQSRLDAEAQAREQERSDFAEQAVALKAAISKMRELQERIADNEQAIADKSATTDLQARETADQASALREKAAQLIELQSKYEADRAELAARESALAHQDAERAVLEEQLAERTREVEAMRRAAEEQAAAIARERQVADADLSGLRKDLDDRAGELRQLMSDLEMRESQLQYRLVRLKDLGQKVAAERKARADSKAQWEEEHRQAAEDLARIRTELEAYREEVIARAAELQQTLPGLEQRGAGALERLTHAREQLKSHVAQLHEFAHQSREDIEQMRQQVMAETERLRVQQMDLGRARSDHRLAVTAFRQQLIDWQGRVAEMKQAIAQGSMQLGDQASDWDEATRDIDSTARTLARQADNLEQDSAAGDAPQSDMRDWFRRELHEFAESTGSPATAHINDLEPGDRALGELLQSLELANGETVATLWTESRRQHRSLRQVLLASGRLTVYQMALIEAGNLDGLMIGPLGVIDRLRVTPHETAFRVIDPRAGNLPGPLVLRHLAESEMQDAVRPDEFRQRFAALAELRHPHIAATIEVLEINDRPAALQEWLTGLIGTDWPSLVASPGVWYRLTCQALLGLATAHQWGLVHGAFSPRSVALTPDGLVKLTGVGEPSWLNGANSNATPADDLLSLGQIAASWAAIVPKRKGAKPPRPLPMSVRDVLERWVTGGYDSATAVLDDLDRAGSDVPSGAETWERLVKFAGENGSEGVAWRKSA